jgi:hypothetical protein
VIDQTHKHGAGAAFPCKARSRRSSARGIDKALAVRHLFAENRVDSSVWKLLGSQGAAYPGKVSTPGSCPGVQNLQPVSGHFSTFAISHEFKANLLAFAEPSQTSALDGADMDEGIIAAAVGVNKAETLLGVEPFHRSSHHGETLLESSFVYQPSHRLSAFHYRRYFLPYAPGILSEQIGLI